MKARPLELARVAAAAALVWAAFTAGQAWLASARSWPPAESRLRSEAEHRWPECAGELAAGWRTALVGLARPLEMLAAAAAAEPETQARAALVGRALAQFDSGRLEAELRDLARLSPAARRLEAPRRMIPVAPGRAVDAQALGEALAALAAAREVERRRLPPGSPLVTDAFRAELAAWLVRGGR
jgi:hypothetical protein